MNIQENQKAAPFFKFENLRIYHKSLMFSQAALAILDTVKNESDKMVAQQLFEAASMITNNIIEGSSANKNAFIGYLQQAKGNIRTCVTYTALLLNRNVIDEEQSNDIRNELIELTKMAGALIVSLQGENN
ncbi:MAG: four helix bundle protein [Bacteroidales bacterium]|nr:four helix bundle protein [Bacteroidales bacterium]MBR5081601.1 four helix bundle protein [Bacteroidales bacterium]